MRTDIYKVALAAAVAGALLLLSSCGSKKNVVTQPGTPETETVATTDPLKAAYAYIAASYKPWTDVSVPVKLELKEPKHFSISGKASMVNGKSVYMSLRFLGMELGAVYVDTDSIYILSKMQRMAYVESLDVFSRNFGITLDDIQSLLLGRAFVPGKGSLQLSDEKSFKIAALGEIITLTPVKLPRNVSWHFKVVTTGTADTFRATVGRLTVDPAGHQPVTALFSSPVETPAGIVAGEVNLSGTLRKKQLSANVIWDMKRAEWNKGISPSVPSVPSGYSRITTQGLLELLSKF